MTMRPPTLERPTQAEGPTSPEVLFKEARERRRRRWARALAVLVVAAAGAGIAYGTTGHGRPARTAKSAAPAPDAKTLVTATRSASAVTVPSAPASISFPTRSDGYLAVGNYLAHTADAARSWSVIRPGLGAIKQVQFLTRKDGFLLTKEGLFSTTDGGSAWSATSKRPVLQWISFSSSTTGWALSNGSLWKTTDAGRRWRRLTTPIAPVEACVVSGRSGWIAARPFSAGAAIWYTTDGGETWVDRSIGTALESLTGTSPYDVVALSCAAPDTVAALVMPTGAGYAGGLNYGVYSSADGGRQWRLVGINPGRDGVAAAPMAQPVALEVASSTSTLVAAACGGCGTGGTSAIGALVNGRTKWHVVRLDGAGVGDVVLMDVPHASSGWAVVADARRAGYRLALFVYRLTLFETRDAGMTWTARPIFAPLGD